MPFVDQDARVVRTKFAKTFRTDFHRLVPGAFEIVSDWCAELERDHAWGPATRFPPTRDGRDVNGRFAPIGLSQKGRATSAPVRDIFRRAFRAAGLPYRNPHSLRSMLVRCYMEMDLSPAQLKAVSQSLGHSDVLTTFTSYGQLPTHRQSELIRAIAEHLAEKEHDPLKELEAVIGRLKAERQNGYAST